MLAARQCAARRRGVPLCRHATMRGSIACLGSIAPMFLAGEKGVGKSGKPLHFKGCNFHRIIPDFMCQGGCVAGVSLRPLEDDVLEPARSC